MQEKLRKIDEELLGKFEEKAVANIFHVKMIGLPMSIAGDMIGNSLGE